MMPANISLRSSVGFGNQWPVDLDAPGFVALSPVGKFKEDGKRNRPTPGEFRKEVADQIKNARRIEDERAAKEA